MKGLKALIVLLAFSLYIPSAMASCGCTADSAQEEEQQITTPQNSGQNNSENGQ